MSGWTLGDRVCVFSSHTCNLIDVYHTNTRLGHCKRASKHISNKSSLSGPKRVFFFYFFFYLICFSRFFVQRFITNASLIPLISEQPNVRWIVLLGILHRNIWTDMLWLHSVIFLPNLSMVVNHLFSIFTWKVTCPIALASAGAFCWPCFGDLPLYWVAIVERVLMFNLKTRNNNFVDLHHGLLTVQ